MSETIAGIIIWASISSIITIIWFIMNSHNQKIERNYQLNKEIYFKMQKNLEIIFNWINFYNVNNRIIINALINQVHIEEDFITSKIQERKGENFSTSQDLLYLYFHTEYSEFLKCMDSYTEVINLYFDKILQAPKIWTSLNYSSEDRKLILEKADNFNQEFIKFTNSLKTKVNQYKDNMK